LNLLFISLLLNITQGLVTDNGTNRQNIHDFPLVKRSHLVSILQLFEWLPRVCTASNGSNYYRRTALRAVHDLKF